MADQPTGPSGSRWEPDSDRAPALEEGTTTPDVAPTDRPYADVPLDEPASDRPTARNRAVLAGAATALALGVGLAGFVIGHSTAGGDRADFRPATFSGQGPGGRPGGDQQVAPGFGGSDGEGDDGGGLYLDGDGNGSSSGESGSSGGSSSSTEGSGTPANPT